MSLEQLEAVSMDESIAVPDGFAIRLKENLGAAETVGLLTENESGSQSAGKMARYAAAAASVAILAGAGLGIARWQSEPKDTFDDPYMAYAELERAFATMSGGVQKALAMAEESEAALDKVVSVFE